MKLYDPQPFFKDQSTKSLNKYRSQSIEQRALRIGKELLVPAFPKKKQQRNLFTITTNSSHQSHKSHQGRSEEQLQRRVRMLEYELKRKLSEDTLLRNIFKTKQTHELNQLDLYLQLKNLEDKYSELAKHEQQSRKIAAQYEQLIKDQEQQHMRNMEELNGCLSKKEQEWAQQKYSLAEQAGKYKMQSEEAKILIQELKKKNSELIKKNKQFSEQLSIQKQSKNLEFIKLKSDYQKQLQSLRQSLSRLHQQLVQITQENQKYGSENNILLHQLEEAQDKNQKLQLQVCQLQEVTHEIAKNQEQLRREEKQKYTSYYQKLRQGHEMEVQQLIKEHQQILKRQRQEGVELTELNKTLKDSIRKLQRQIIEANKQLQGLQNAMKQLQERISILTVNNEKEIQANAKLSRQCKQLKFQKEEIHQLLEEAKFQLKDHNQTEQKLLSKIKSLEQQNERLVQKVEELKITADNSQAYRKLNDKIYNENYKTLGRLIEICNKMRQHIQQGGREQGEAQDLLARTVNEQSLGDVVSTLADLLTWVLRWNQSLKKHKEQLIRQRNIENRQICNILQHFRNTLINEESLALVSKYILILKERKILSSQQNKERVEVYHQLIEHLINRHTSNYHSSDHHKPKLTKDSLDSTHLLRNNDSRKKECKLIERQSSCKYIPKKHRIETEPSSYDLPLKRKLIVEEEDKENLNLNANKSEHQQLKKYPNRYSQEVRQRITQKYPSKRKEQSQCLRSQVEKKYFRS